jgi:hypothetical protein
LFIENCILLIITNSYTYPDSLDEQEHRIENQRRAAEYTFEKPWDQDADHGDKELQRQVEALSYELVAPWTDDTRDEKTDLRQKMDAISYQVIYSHNL